MCKENSKANARPAKWRPCNYDINGIDPLGSRERHQVNKNLSQGEKKLCEANKKPWGWEKAQRQDTAEESQRARQKMPPHRVNDHVE